MSRKIKKTLYSKKDEAVSKSNTIVNFYREEDRIIAKEENSAEV